MARSVRMSRAATKPDNEMYVHLLPFLLLLLPEQSNSLTIPGIVTASKIYIFSALGDHNSSNSQILLGEISLAKAFTLGSYEVEWWTSPNFTDVVYFVAGDDSRLYLPDPHSRLSNSRLTAPARLFNTQQRVGYGVSNKTAALVSYDPSSHELDTVDLTSQLPQGTLPTGGENVIVRDLKMSYYIGSQGMYVDVGSPMELFAFNYSANTVVRKPMPANIWATVSYIRVGKKDILVMLGGIDGIHLLPVSRNFESPQSPTVVNFCYSWRWIRSTFTTSLPTRDISSRPPGLCRRPGR